MAVDPGAVSVAAIRCRFPRLLATMGRTIWRGAGPTWLHATAVLRMTGKCHNPGTKLVYSGEGLDISRGRCPVEACRV